MVKKGLDTPLCVFNYIIYINKFDKDNMILTFSILLFE